MHHARRPAMMTLTALAIAATTCAASPLAARAGTPAFAGTWGKDAAECKVPQDQQGAPMMISAKGYDQHEAHCTFASIGRKGRVWKIDARCSVEGDKQKDTFTLQLKGDKLEMTRGAATQTFVRCK